MALPWLKRGKPAQERAEDNAHIRATVEASVAGVPRIVASAPR